MVEQRGLRPAEPGAADSTDGPRNAHAVVVGINEYADARIRNLRFARADAEDLVATLVDPALGRFDPDRVTLLTDKDATRRNIVGAIGTGLKRAAAPDDLVCVFFAGHGATDPDSSAGSGDGLTKYLLPHDADVDDLFSTAVPMKDVDQFFQRIEARQIIFFLDACYSGGADTFATRSILTEEFIQQLGQSGEGRMVITSCKPNEVSLEREDFGGGHGLFSHYLLQGLQGAADEERSGLVSLDGLYNYVNKNVADRAREVGGSMSPIRTGSVQGDIFLTAYQTPEQKEADGLHEKAREYFDADRLHEAHEAWTQALVSVPGHAGAAEGLEHTEALIQARKQRLVGLNREGSLPNDVLVDVLGLLRRNADELDENEAYLREKALALSDGTLGAETFVDIWAAGPGAPTVTTSPPAPPTETGKPAPAPTREEVEKPSTGAGPRVAFLDSVPRPALLAAIGGAVVIAFLFAVRPWQGDDPAPAILELEVERDQIQAGDTVTLRWATANASWVRLEPMGRVDSAGLERVAPPVDTKYVLTAFREVRSDSFVTVSDSVWVRVIPLDEDPDPTSPRVTGSDIVANADAFPEALVTVASLPMTQAEIDYLLEHIDDVSTWAAENPEAWNAAELADDQYRALRGLSVWTDTGVDMPSFMAIHLKAQIGYQIAVRQLTVETLGNEVARLNQLMEGGVISADQHQEQTTEYRLFALALERYPMISRRLYAKNAEALTSALESYETATD